MSLPSSLKRMRPFAALLLLLGAILGGTIDAAACEPVTETFVAVGAVESQPDTEKLPSGDRDGVCIHGHCHHGISHIETIALVGEEYAYHVDHPPWRDQSLASIVPDNLMRPPRA